MKWTLLYFDDQAQNIEAFKEILGGNFHVIGCQDSTKFAQALEAHHPHIILLDVHMPILDGHSLYRSIAEHPLYNGCPVIFISGDQSEENKLRSFENGGIDFLSRDLGMEELIVRITNKVKFFLDRSTSLELGNLVVDVRTMAAFVDGRNVDLTLLELRMLSHIVRSYPKSLTRQELILKVWGTDTVKPGTINTHLTNLKPKIEGWNHQIRVRDESVLVQLRQP